MDGWMALNGCFPLAFSGLTQFGIRFSRLHHSTREIHQSSPVHSYPPAYPILPYHPTLATNMVSEDEQCG